MVTTATASTHSSGGRNAANPARPTTDTTIAPATTSVCACRRASVSRCTATHAAPNATRFVAVNANPAADTPKRPTSSHANAEDTTVPDTPTTIAVTVPPPRSPR